MDSLKNTCEFFQLKLPYNVNEAIIFNDGFVGVDCSDECAWTLFGQKLLVWEYKKTEPKCYEIKSPYFNVKKELIYVLKSECNTIFCQFVSICGKSKYCLVVDNIVLWSDESQIKLETEETLIAVASLTKDVCVLVTTKSNLFQLRLVQNKINISPIKLSELDDNLKLYTVIY